MSERQRATLMDFPFPLRDDLTVYFRGPRDLTVEEADRLGEFIRSLVRHDDADQER